MRAAIRAEAPTYVDDLAALLRGARQTLRAAFYLIFASWAAGLEVSAHECAELVYRDDSAALRTVCGKLPVIAWKDSNRGEVHVRGMPPDLLRDLIQEMSLWGSPRLSTHLRGSLRLPAPGLPGALRDSLRLSARMPC